MAAPPVFVGLDVAKAQLALALRPTGARGAVTNDETGMAALVVQLQALQPTLSGLEATGGYHRAVGAALGAAALPIVVVHPRRDEIWRKRPGSGPQPRPALPVPWRTLQRLCGLRRALDRMPNRQSGARSWHGGGNEERGGPPSRTA